MSGIYGDMLLSFPEQNRAFTYFDMPAQINDGYGNRTDVSTILGIIQNAQTSVKDSNGNIVKIDNMNLWTMEELVRGRFVEFESIVYRIVGGGDWPSQGGFYNYTLEKLVGTNGTSNDATVWSNGSTQF